MRWHLLRSDVEVRMSDKVTWHAEDISCEHCATTIQRELAPIDGIANVVVDVAAKDVTIEYTDSEALARAKSTLEEIGYPVS